MVPDDVLFEGGAGKTVRSNLLGDCDVQTLLRLATSVFYAHGVKSDVLFFQRGAGGEEVATRELWICYLRTSQHFTLKANPLQRHHLDDFVACYNSDDRSQRAAGETEQCRRFTYDELVNRDKTNLDIFWLRAESLEYPEFTRRLSPQKESPAYPGSRWDLAVPSGCRWGQRSTIPGR